MAEDFIRPWHKFYPKSVAPTLNYPQKPLPGLLEEIAQDYPDVLAYVFAGQSVTYRQFNHQVRKFAAALTGLGVKKGDRVAVMAPNCPQYVISYYALLKIGAVVVQTNPMYTPREVEHQLNDSGAQMIIVYDALYPAVGAVKDHTPLNTIVAFSLGEKALKGEEEVLWFDELLAKETGEPPEVEIDLANDVAVLQYTGGTTGVSKGAMLTHKNVMYDAYMVKVWTDCKEMGAVKSLVVLPLFHSFGMSTSMNATILMAGTMLLVPRFEPQTVLELIKTYRPTYFHGVPTMYTALLGQPNLKDYDLSCIEVCISGGAPLPVEVQQKFQAAAGADVLEGYGLSETSPVTHCNPVGGVNKVGSIGPALPDTDCKIADLETGTKEMPVGQEGELCIKGPQVMLGYWNRPEETASVLRDGWLFTGDVAKMDEDGYFYIVDRKKEMILAGGYNVYPREVEEVLYEIPEVAEAAVTGVPDEYRGETVWAFLALKPGTSLTEEGVINYCRERLAAYKAPRVVKFVDQIPKSTVGKILRRELKDLVVNKQI